MSLTAAQLEELVNMNLPAFVFAPDERFYPSDTAAWITSSLAESWTAGGTRLSGTALMRAPAGEATFPAGFGSAQLIAGSAFPGGTRLQPDEIGALRATVDQLMRDGQDVFLNYGGWLQPGGGGAPQFVQGSHDRIYPRFSNLANAVNAGNPVEADTLQNVDAARPNVTQPREVFVYAEVDWAGIYSRISDRQPDPEHRDFGPSSAVRQALDRFIVVTYYLFYPMTEYPPDPESKRAASAVRREGQWEAVSLYYHTRLDPTPRFPKEDGLPFVTFEGTEPSHMQLMFASYSRTSRSDESVPGAEARSVYSGGVEFASQDSSFGFKSARSYRVTNPKVYVTSGTHKNLFNWAATTKVEEGGPNANLAAAAGVAGTAGGGLMAGCAIPPLCILGIFFLVIAALLAIASVAMGENDKTSYGPTGPDNDYVPPGGIAVGGSYPVWVPTRVQTISRLAWAAGEEQHPVNHAPAWWDYPGRWGIRVERSATARWDNGTRRVDSRNRSRAYWNTLALLRFLNANPAEAERIVGS